LNFLIKNIKNFIQVYVHGIDNIIGVRIPKLRNLAKEIINEDYKTYLDNAKDDYYEEIMLQGLVIGYYNCDIQNVIKLCSNFVPKIDNWSICDSFCNSLKISKDHPSEMLNYISRYINSDKTYEIRFLLVMLLNYYIDKQYLNTIFDIVEKVQKEDYYVKMAVAWLVSICYIKFPSETLHYIANCHLDKFTYNKSLQKILESYRVSEQDKKMIRSMKI